MCILLLSPVYTFGPYPCSIVPPQPPSLIQSGCDSSVWRGAMMDQDGIYADATPPPQLACCTRSVRSIQYSFAHNNIDWCWCPLICRQVLYCSLFDVVKYIFVEKVGCQPIDKMIYLGGKMYRVQCHYSTLSVLLTRPVLSAATQASDSVNLLKPTATYAVELWRSEEFLCVSKVATIVSCVPPRWYIVLTPNYGSHQATTEAKPSGVALRSRRKEKVVWGWKSVATKTSWASCMSITLPGGNAEMMMSCIVIMTEIAEQ